MHRKAPGTLLHHIGDLRAPDARPVILEDVRLARGDDKAEAVGSATNHAFNKVFTHGAWPFLAVFHAAAHGKEFF